MYNRRHQFILVANIWLMAVSNLFGQTTYFEKPDNVTWSDSSAYIDSITTDIGITRDYYGPLFNGYTEESYESGLSPEGTLWANGPTPLTSNPFTYLSFDQIATDGNRSNLPGQTMSLFIVADSLFFDIEWVSWTAGGGETGEGGGFAYNRTPASAPLFEDDSNAVYFRKDDGAENDSINWDWVSTNVAIWRNYSGPLYNPLTEEEGPVDNVSPGGTLWAHGSVPAEVTPFYYSQSFDQVADNNRQDLPGQVLSMFVPENNSYWDIEFVSWTNNQNGGGFAYIRRSVEPVVLGDPDAIYFQKMDYADFDADNFDWITENVAIWRHNSGRIFNAAEEEGPESGLSPTRTLWARGPTPLEATPIHYAQFDDAYPRENSSMRNIVGEVMSLFVPDSNLYFDIEWYRWTSNENGGGFAYSRTPATAPTIVSDPDLVYFRILNYSDVSNPDNWDVISDSVAITRGSSGPIFNPIFEEEASNFTSPSKTKWAPGPTAEQMYNSNYSDFLSAAGGRWSLGSLPGRTLSLYVEDLDTYFDVNFLSWKSGGGGGLAYTRIEEDAPVFMDESDWTYYLKPANSEAGDSLAWDWISENVALYRDYSGPIYNAALEEGVESGLSPVNTFWTRGLTPATADPFTYVPFQHLVPGNRTEIPGSNMSLMVMEPGDTSYYDVQWLTWTSGETGGFSYLRRPAMLTPIFGMEPDAVTFIKYDGTDGDDPLWQDMISDSVALTSDNSGLYNAVFEAENQSYLSPTRTLWANGPTANQHRSWDYTDIQSATGGYISNIRPGQIMSLWLPGEALFFDIQWVEWTNHVGGFAYIRRDASPPTFEDDPLAVYFIKDAHSSASDSTQWDRITPDVAITRGQSDAIFNPLLEEGYQDYVSPVGTRWAMGTTAGQMTPYAYGPFGNIVSNGERRNLPGHTLSLHIPELNQYYDVYWVTWTSGQTGGFSYVRTPANPPEYPMDPTVVHFIKHDYAHPYDSTAQDRITPEVWITRDNYRPLFNAYSEEGPNDGSPQGTRWSLGSTASQNSQWDYSVFGEVIGRGESTTIPGRTMSLFIPADSLYFDVEWLTWKSNGEGGGFSYRRTEVSEPVFDADSGLVFFEKDDYAVLDSSLLWDVITDSVAIYRGFSGPLYNPIIEMEYESEVSPAKTLWARGLTEDVFAPSLYQSFDVIVGSGERQELPGQHLSLWLPEDSLFFDVRFVSWSSGSSSGGGFSYFRRPADAPVFEIDPNLVLFIKPDGSPNELPFMDMISADVILTRGTGGPIFNAALENEFIWGQSPTNTLWTYGPTAEVNQEFDYRVFDEVVGSQERRELPGRLMSVFLTEEDRYFDIQWLSWSSGNRDEEEEDEGGNRGFSYLRREVPAPEYEIDPTAILFEKPDGADPADSLFWDIITPEVAITRGEDGPIFNPRTESEFIPGQSPTGTLWAAGPTGAIFSPQEYGVFDEIVGDGQRRALPGRVLSLWLPEANLFFDIQWLSWSSGGDGDDREGNPGFAYLRSPVNPPLYVEHPDMVYFARRAYAYGNGPDNLDHISENVAITRENDGGSIFNAYLDFDDDEAAAPTGTFWARGRTSQQSSMEAYSNFGTTWDYYEQQNISGQVSSLYVEEIDTFFDVYWRTWGRSDGGSFSYVRIPAGHLYREVNSDWMNPEFQDRISVNVALTRLPEGGPLINVDTETAAVQNVSPEGTLWARGATRDQDARGDYKDFKSAMSNRLRDLPGETLSLHVLGTGLYYDVYFAEWGQGGGSVEYFRSWTQAPVFLPHAPETFEMHELTEPIVITHDNVGSGVLTLSWDAASDMDLDILRYRVTAALDSTLAEGTFVDSIVDDTAFEVSYQQLFDGLDFLGLSGGEFTWLVSAMDDEHETPASNGPQFISIDATPVSISDLSVPEQFSLQQNFPNPFNPTTTIRYGIPEQSDVRMFIYDIKGRQIQTIEMLGQTAGWYDLVWNGRNNDGLPVSTGLYFCRLHAGSYSETIKMVYLK